MDHIAKINELIPLAEREANRIIELTGQKTEIRLGVDGMPFVWNYFSEHFHKAMNRMAIKAGVRREYERTLMS